MKFIKLLPLLIAAAFYVPRAHAANTGRPEKPDSAGVVLTCLALIVLAGRRGGETFKNDR